MEKSLYKIFSFYNKEVNPRVPVYQKAVFRHFGFQIQQVYNNEFSHGDFLNDICRQVTDAEYLIVFDIDCIPVNKKWIDDLLADLKQPDSLVGAAQTANHLRDGKNLYISPFFFAIATEYLKELNYPDMRMTEQIKKAMIFRTPWMQVSICRKSLPNRVAGWYSGGPRILKKTNGRYTTRNITRFGLGTTYHDNIYHAFYSRSNLSNRFLEKCKQIIGK